MQLKSYASNQVTRRSQLHKLVVDEFIFCQHLCNFNSNIDAF